MSGLSYRRRKWLSILVLTLGVPLYIAAAITLVGLFDRPPVWVELLVYVALGIVWILPLRRVFLGVGRPDPDSGDDR